MAKDCTTPGTQTVSGAFPATQSQNAGALQVNLSAESDAIFNPNNALAAVNTYLSLNNVANKMFGIDARWFRAVPQERSKEVILQEWTLYCVEESPICLKVLVPGGNFPDSKYQFDLMGLEYEVPLTINIDKKYWEEMAGFGTAPQKKDIVYLPMPNRLYQVESAYLDRGFMQQETTWVLNLRKYMPEASRRESAPLKETIDKYTVSTQEIFGVDIQNEYDKISNDKQFSPFNSTNRDKYKSLDVDIKIIPSILSIHGLEVAQSYYDMATSRNFNGVIYNYTDEIGLMNDRAITEWINLRPTASKENPVIWIQSDTMLTVPANYKIKVQASKRFVLGDTMVISRPGALNFYGVIIDDTEAVDGIYYIQIDDDVIDHLNSIYPSWLSAKNYKMVINDPVTVMDGINMTDTGFKVLLYANQYVKLIYGTQVKVACLPNRLNNNQWYGLVVNIGNSTGQYNVYVWEYDTNPVTKLKILSYKTMDWMSESILVGRYSVDKSNAFLTNIRLFCTMIEEEKQAIELLSYFTKDSDQALILDNVDPRFRAPYISQQK